MGLRLSIVILGGCRGHFKRYHRGNRLGYFISNVPFSDDTDIEAILD
jgi:hypothetical protein